MPSQAGQWRVPTILSIYGREHWDRLPDDLRQVHSLEPHNEPLRVNIFFFLLWKTRLQGIKWHAQWWRVSGRVGI